MTAVMLRRTSGDCPLDAMARAVMTRRLRWVAKAAKR